MSPRIAPPRRDGLRSVTAEPEWVVVAFGGLLLLALGLRLALITSWFGEIDSDEAVVGLMALQIPHELPAFYWEQHYAGSLESIAAAYAFAAFGPSATSLKLVPAAFSVAYIGLVFISARAAFGWPVALISAAYLAIPPSFFAVWSVKARGGYAEMLALGHLFLVLCQRATMAGGAGPVLLGTIGVVGGLAVWTHPVAAVYLVTGAILAAGTAYRERVPGRRIAAATAVVLLGLAVGCSPAIVHLVREGAGTFSSAAEAGVAPRAAVLNLWGLTRYGAPVLVGLAEGTASKTMLDEDWPQRLGSIPAVTVALLLVVLLATWSQWRAIPALFRRGGGVRERAAAPFLVLLLAIPPFVAVSRFAELWAEPRYALPVYSAVPLFVAAALSLASRARWLGWGAIGAAFLLNLWSLATSDPRLSLPTNAGESTRANRQELIRHLAQQNQTRIYTDYWLAYPIAFESSERIIPSVWSGGFNRRAAYAHQVAQTANPTFVFARDTRGDQQFRALLQATDGRADVARVGVYHVYSNVTPLVVMRP
ncbi:MAG: hypothetical protein U0821_07965 [Chloroflexota bacterium]